MDREERNQGPTRPLEPEFVLQWGKRLRCNRVKNPNHSPNSNGGIRRRITSGAGVETSRSQSNGFARGSQPTSFRSPSIERRKSVSPEKEDRYYTTRGSLVGGGGGNCSAAEENRKSSIDVAGEEKVGVGGGAFVWPKLYVSLSKKEKEEDFLAMKGCKLPQRPKKRAKFIQRSLLLVSPGAWLSDLCQERYEVREKKTSKKRPRGLKAMGAVESDSE
ncbi:hypothetical protein V2J09_013757 [Rumex salicifolius]